MRDASLGVINAARSSSDELRIAYASKQSSRWQKDHGYECFVMNVIKCKDLIQKVRV